MNLRPFCIFFLLCFLYAFQTKAQNIDINTVKSINGWHIHGLSKGLSTSGLVIPAGIPISLGLYAIIEKDESKLKDALYIGTSVIEAVGVSYSLKLLTDRERPFTKYPEKITPYGHISDRSSFPSDHTAAAFSLAASLSIKYPQWYIVVPSALWAVSVGVARMNQGAHYPSDVLCGAAIGIGCAFVNVYVNNWLNKVLLKK